MLRLTKLHGSDRLTIKVEGQIVAEWAVFLEQECLAPRQMGTRVVIDLADVHFVDLRGIATLQRLQGAGLSLEHCPPLVDELLRTTEPT